MKAIKNGFEVEGSVDEIRQLIKPHHTKEYAKKKHRKNYLIGPSYKKKDKRTRKMPKSQREKIRKSMKKRWRLLKKE